MRRLVTGALTGALVAFATAQSMAQTVAIGTLEQGSVFHTMGSVISRVARDTENLGIVVQPNGGTFAMLSATNQGLSDFAIDDVNDIIAASQGVDEYEGNALENLRMVINLRPLPMGLIVRKDSGIDSVDDLRGKRLPSGWSAFPIANSHIEAVLATNDMTMDDVVGVPTTGLIRAADDFVAGRLDATYFAVGAPKVAEMNASVGGIKYLPVADTPEALAAAQGVRAAFYISTVPPLAHLAGIEAPTPLVTWDVVVVANKDVPDETVTTLVRSILENKPALVEAYPPFGPLNPETAAKPYPGLEYHSGAIAYFEQAGLWPAQN